MLERTSMFYGKEAAANDKPNNAEVDKEFNMWMAEILGQMELPDEEFADMWEHLIDCWESGYLAYKRGEVI